MDNLRVRDQGTSCLQNFMGIALRTLKKHLKQIVENYANKLLVWRRQTSKLAQE